MREITRRNALTGSTAAVAALTLPAAPALARGARAALPGTPDPDAELIRRCRAVRDAKAAHSAAFYRWFACYREHESRSPPLPERLRHLFPDPPKDIFGEPGTYLFDRARRELERDAPADLKDDFDAHEARVRSHWADPEMDRLDAECDETQYRVSELEADVHAVPARTVRGLMLKLEAVVMRDQLKDCDGDVAAVVRNLIPIGLAVLDSEDAERIRAEYAPLLEEGAS